MQVLKDILQESLVYYRRLGRDLERQIAKLPRGTVKKRHLRGHVYYYLQRREGDRVVHKYLGVREPSELVSQIERRRMLTKELGTVRAALKLIPQKKLLA